jgi:histidine triad (HIT) family protein
MEQTIFHKILSREIPADIVFENDVVLAFRDLKPQAPTHVLVIPKFALADLRETTQFPPDKIGAFLQGVTLTARALGLDDTGYRTVFNSGKGGGQEVPYLHAHILAGRTLTWPPG